jgi:hypothetical protein
MSATYEGHCFCGAVRFTVTGEPKAMGYCHCASCRAWLASPVNAAALFPQDNVKVTAGADKIGTYNKTDNAYRKWCTVCGGHLFTNHPKWGVSDVYVALIPDFPFTPALHVNYEETRLPMKDGLPKMRDFPSELGGSGQTLPE